MQSGQIKADSLLEMGYRNVLKVVNFEKRNPFLIFFIQAISLNYFHYYTRVDRQINFVIYKLEYFKNKF